MWVIAKEIGEHRCYWNISLDAWHQIEDNSSSMILDCVIRSDRQLVNTILSIRETTPNAEYRVLPVSRLRIEFKQSESSDSRDA